jgi:hypothetical protein
MPQRHGRVTRRAQQERGIVCGRVGLFCSLLGLFIGSSIGELRDALKKSVELYQVCVCVCVCERERERERECVCVRE